MISKSYSTSERRGLTSDGRFLLGVLPVLGVVALVAAFDLWSDFLGASTTEHMVAEAATLVVGLIGALALIVLMLRVLRSARAARQENAELSAQLKVTQAEAARWRNETRELLGGLSAAIDRQFERWALSPAEKEVALLLLKGLSHKELAEVRSITEATARQQARAVYRKAGLSGRNDLAAFFLEDLLLPSVQLSSRP